MQNNSSKVAIVADAADYNGRPISHILRFCNNAKHTNSTSQYSHHTHKAHTM